MVLKYNVDIQDIVIEDRLKRLTNETYKLLPSREEGTDWERPLSTIIEEFAGMDRLFIGQQEKFFPLLSKLEGLFTLTEENDFQLYRRTIFECLSLIGQLGKECR